MKMATPVRSGPQQQIRGGSSGGSQLHMGNPGGRYYPTVQPRPSAMFATIPVICPTLNVPVQGPNFEIPSGYYVEVSLAPGSIGVVSFSTVSRQAVLSGPFESCPAAGQAPRQIDVRNLNEIWVNSASNGGGMNITVRKIVS